MRTINTQDNIVAKLCDRLIEHSLGDLSKFPQALVDCVHAVYREFMIGYLNILRQEEKKPADWIPATVSIDPELTAQMRHFFSDYQHVTGKFYKLNLEVKRLQDMDRDNHPKLYQHAIDRFMKRFAPPVNTGENYEKYG